MQEFFQNTVLPAVMGFVNTKAVRAVKDGLVYSMPLIIVGAVFLLLFQLPVESLANMVTASGLVPALRQGYTSSFQIVGLMAALASPTSGQRTTATSLSLQASSPLPCS